MKRHIESAHGDFECRRCLQTINVRNLYTHEVAHLKEDIVEGRARYGDWSTDCCYCGIKRDKKGFHYCSKNYLYLSYRVSDVKKPTGKLLQIIKTTKVINPYALQIKTEMNNVMQNNKKVKTITEQVKPRAETGVDKTDKSIINRKMQQLQKSKKHLFTPKLPAKYDSDNTDDEYEI